MNKLGILKPVFTYELVCFYKLIGVIFEIDHLAKLNAQQILSIIIVELKL